MIIKAIFFNLSGWHLFESAIKLRSNLIAKFQSQYIINSQMQQDRPQRGQRRRAPQTLELDINVNSFKEFLGTKLDFSLPQDYPTMNDEQKQNIWTEALQRLKTQREKILYLFPDTLPIDEVNFAIQVIKKNNTNDLIGFEHEELFMGNKKQLLIYLKCKQMDSYLEKYRLPKPFEKSYPEIEKISKEIFQNKIQRNIAISLFDRQKIDDLNTKMKALQAKFDKEFKKFQTLMRSIFEHFKSQNKTTVINLQALRLSLYERLKVVAESCGLFMYPKYPDVDNDEFLHIQVTKKNQYDTFFDAQNMINEQDENMNFSEDDKSSVVSDLSEEEKQLQIQNQLKRSKPPVGIYSISFEKYQNKLVTVKIVLQVTRNQYQIPKQLEYSDGSWFFKSSVEITQHLKDQFLQIPMQKGRFFSHYFRTKNGSGYSHVRNFKYLLNLDSDSNALQNGNLIMLGHSKALIPEQRHRKEGEFYHVTLAVSDFSISSTQTLICDADGNSADWGYIKKDNQKEKQVIESNNYYQIVNNANNMYLQEPAIRLDRSHNIVKVSCGRGYGMLLDAYGTIWMFGKNTSGQLGTKEQVKEDETIELKFFQQKKIFITDIKASEFSASFAIDSNGTLYKWGPNQLLTTNQPIYDRFGTIMNYSLQNSFEEQWSPLPVKKHFQNQKIEKIECGHEFYLILNNQGTLYGWGQCRNLGKGVLKDGKDQEIYNICNDIQIMKNVQKVSASKQSALVFTKDAKVLGWGNLKFLSDQKNEFSYIPVDLTNQYGQVSQEDILACGPTYTCLYKKEANKLRLFGQTIKFSNKEYDMKANVRKIECGQDIIAFLGEKKGPRQ